MDLILGTAQFTRSYGSFAASADSPRRLVEFAQDAGIRVIDTAPVYGNAEERIGNLGWKGSVHTKISSNEDPYISLLESLERLRRDSVDVLYFHDPTVVHKPQQYFTQVRSIIPISAARWLGISVYSIEEFLLALEIPELMAIQVPMSLVDRRFSGELLRLGLEQGRQIFCRSIFLQGALLKTTSELPKFLAPLGPTIDFLDNLALRHGYSRIDLLVGWVKQHSHLRGLVVGAECQEQLKEIVRAFQREPINSGVLSEMNSAQSNGLPIDPRAWND